MSENNEQTASPPAKRTSGGQWKKGQCPNPKGRGKGNLSKTTRFQQMLTTPLKTDAVTVLRQVLKQAKAGDKDSQKMVMSLLQPFVKKEAEAGDGSKSKRPLININVGVAEGMSAPIRARVIEAEDADPV
jgi:hypothetical protein